MLGGFEPIPKFKRIFCPSEYKPKWGVIVVAPILLLWYGWMFIYRKVLRR